MINADVHSLAWIGLVDQLDDAREHLETLVKEMVSNGRIDESAFSTSIAHVFAHLNRAWHLRNQESEISDEQWVPYSKFPDDLQPIG